jgi:hypothetical protein
VKIIAGPTQPFNVGTTLIVDVPDAIALKVEMFPVPLKLL